MLLLDFHMPGASGMDVLEAIRAKGSFVAIILTGQGNVVLAVQAMKAGALDFIEKPYDAEFLLEVGRNGLLAARAGRQRHRAGRFRQGQDRKAEPRETDVLLGLIQGARTR
ncbi:MAG: response regulator [Sphingomonas sp.]